MIAVKRLVNPWLLGLLSLCFASQVAAAPIVVTSRAALGGDDFIDWGQMGADGTSVTVFPYGVTSNSTTISASVYSSGGRLTKLTQGVGWNGNFASGDQVAWTTGSGGPIDIRFGTLLYGVGAQIQENPADGHSFTARLDVYDASNGLLGSFNLAGTSTSAGDNSAIFIGAEDSTASIKRIVFDTSTSDFAINRLELLTVPSPSTLLLLALGLVILSGTRRGR